MKSTAELIAAGIKAQQAKHQDGEGAKLGAYRVGSSGILALGGKVVGGCMRLGHLRSLGVEVEATSADREHMFAGGRSNEDVWAALLRDSAQAGLSVLREEEFPVAHRLPNGKLLMGRPDIVLGTMETRRMTAEEDAASSVPGGWNHVTEFKAVRLLELKQVSAMKTAVEVGTLYRPKLDHVIQAAHYSLRLGLPIELWYTNRVDFNLTEKAIAEIPAGNPNVQYGWNQKAFKVLPFIQGYALSVSPTGQVCYQAIGVSNAPLVHTIVTTQGLDAYFDQLSRMEETDVLPPMVAKLDLQGGEASWRKCDYCPLKPVCTANKTGSVKKWVDEAKVFLQSADKQTGDNAVTKYSSESERP